MHPKPSQIDWTGSHAVCIANGPSLTFDDVFHVYSHWHRDHRLKVFGCNDAYRIAPWMDVFYACDLKWWKVHGPDVVGLRCWSYTQDKTAAREWKVGHIDGDTSGGNGFSFKPDFIHFGGSSGFQLMNLAIAFGIRKIYMLGYDCKMNGDRQHWFGNHPSNIGFGQCFNQWVRSYREVIPQIDKHNLKIINCSRDTAIDAFPRSTIQEVLND